MKRTTLIMASLVAVLAFASVAQASPVSRAQAVRTAKDYVALQGFSFKGLVQQLRFEGYSLSDSRYGASHAGANWNREAVQAARDYLATQGFSRSGMVSQLMFDGFTHAQALHGALTVGL